DDLAVTASLFGPQFQAGQSLQSNQLVVAPNAAATQAGVATFLFSTTNGVLRFDADGLGGAGPVHVATLNVRTLTLDDFAVI
ncbi:MAG TPA: hypothetical protein DCL48_12490, partial [Alphaproteobacteria bacterium]|nr:hypothetical protein [Alphaproteobacteria bacterium]